MGLSLGSSLCLGHCLGLWLEWSENWRITVLCCGTGSPGRKEVLDDVGEGHLPPLTKGGHERSPVAALVCSEHFSEAPNILRKLLLAQILLLHRRLRGWESLASQNLEVCLPRSRTKSKWGSQRLGVARERAQHVCPLHTHGGTF